MRRVLRILGWSGAALLLLLVAAWLFRGPLFGPFVVARIERELSAQLGGRYRLTRVEGSWFGDLALVGLRTEEPPPGALRRLEFGRAVVTYDLAGLLGDDPLGAIRSVTVSNARVEVDLTRAAEPEAPAGPAEDPLALLPERLPEIEIEGDVGVRTEAGDLGLDGLLVQTSGTGAVALRAGHVRLPETWGPGGALAATVERTGRRLVWTSETPVSGITLREASYAGGAAEGTLLVGESEVRVTFRDGALHAESDRLDLAHLPAWLDAELERQLPDPPPARLAFAVDVATFAPLAATARVRSEPFAWRGAAVEEATAEGAWRDGRAVIGSATVRAEQVQVEARDLVVEPARPYLLGAVGRLDVRVDDLRRFVPDLDRAVSVELVAASDDLQAVRITRARVAAEGLLLEGSGSVALPAAPERWRETTFLGELGGTLTDFRTRAYAMEGALTATARVHGSVDAPVADVALDGQGLRVEGRGVDRLELRAALAWPALDVQALRVESEPGSLVVEGTVDLERRRIEAGRWRVNISDLDGFARLFPGTPPARGTVRGSGTVAHGPDGLHGTAALELGDFAIDGHALGDLTVEASAERDLVSVTRLAGQGAWGAAQGRGLVHLGQHWARVDELHAERGRVVADLAGPARVAWGDEGVRLTSLDLAVAGGRVTGSVRWRERPDVALKAAGLDLAALDARCAGRVDVEVTATQGAYALEVRAPQVAFEGRTGELFLRAAQTPQGLEVERFAAYARDLLAVEAHALLPWRLEGERLVRVADVAPRLHLDAQVRQVAELVPGLHVEAASLTVDGDGRRLDATARFERLSPFGKLHVPGRTLLELHADPERVEGSVATERGELGELAGKFQLDRGVDWMRPFDLQPFLETARIEGELHFRIGDLAPLAHLLPDVVLLGGAAAADLRVSGPLRAPEVYGNARCEGITCAVTGDTPPLQKGDARLRFDGRTVEIERFNAELGYAPVSLRGRIDLGAAPELDLVLRGENCQLVRSRHLRVRTDLQVHITGPPDAPLARGDVTITSALYSEPIAYLARGPRGVDQGFTLFSVREGPLSRLRFDVHVAAEESIRVHNNVLRGVFSADLRLHGTGSVPLLTGRVNCRDVLVDLPLTGLKVDRGELHFAEEAPFDPRLSVAAHTRMRGYDLDVLLDGPVSEAELTILSRPSLSQEDALLLLTSGRTRSELEGADAGRTALGTAGALFGQQLLASMSGPRDPDARTFFDRFTVSVGRDVSKGGEETVEGEFEVVPGWYLRVERDRFEDYNGGVVRRIRFK